MKIKTQKIAKENFFGHSKIYLRDLDDDSDEEDFFLLLDATILFHLTVYIIVLFSS